MNRLAVGDDDCIPPGHHTPGYIYKQYKYEPEGCYKSCYQNKMLMVMQCVDPRYPAPRNGSRVCNTLDMVERECGP